jgi:glycosyltransferase involved in cell wall biosynthesis
LLNDSPEISIVMPVRDAAATLPATLDSIRRQTFTAWELVVVDDGSEDETPQLLKDLAASDARIRVLTRHAQGIVGALQYGCAAARGRFLARMDADDWMSPDRLQRQAAFLDRHPGIGVVSCRVRFGGDPATQEGYAAHVAWINSLLTPQAIARRRFVESPVAHPSVLFRRELLEQHGGYAAGDFPEDYELWLRWMDAGVRFGKVDAELLVWNDPPTRLSRIGPRYRPDAFYRIKCAYLARWLARHVSPSRELWLWGAGRITRQRFRPLESAGLPLAGFIDIDARKLGQRSDGRSVVGLDDLPPQDRAFILGGVGSRGAREQIAAELERRGRAEGEDYLLVA